MTTRQKIIAGAIAIGAVFVWAGYATFDQWSGFVAQVIPFLGT